MVPKPRHALTTHRMASTHDEAHRERASDHGPPIPKGGIWLRNGRLPYGERTRTSSDENFGGRTMEERGRQRHYVTKQ